MIGYVTHGSDRSLWAFRLPILEPPQVDVARNWLNAIAEAVQDVEKGNMRGVRDILTLKEDRTIEWTVDGRWDELMRLKVALPGEGTEE